MLKPFNSGTIPFEEAHSNTELVRKGNGVEKYVEYMSDIRREIASSLPAGVVFTLNSIVAGPDGPDAGIHISVQSEFADRIRELVPHAHVRDLLQHEYEIMTGGQDQRMPNAA
jgi:hypothetical protein